MTINIATFELILIVTLIPYLCDSLQLQVPPTVATASSVSVSKTAKTLNKDCIVVGGGPIGLATALTLARAPHYYNVTVLESSKSLDEYIDYDPSKAYLYNVNSKGLDWFYRTTNNANAPSTSVLQQLKERGYCPLPAGSMGNFIIIPANPEKAIRQNLSRRNSSASSNSNGKNDTTTKVERSHSYWIPRHQMIELLHNCCYEHNNHSATTKIKICTNSKVEKIFTTNPGPKTVTKGRNTVFEGETSVDPLISVLCSSDQAGGGTTYAASLIVAADGINSIVRKSLQQITGKSRKFRVKKYKSPATGLQLKVLQFHHNLTIANGTNIHNKNHVRFVQPKSTDFVVLRGINNGYRNRLSIGMLPMKDPSQVRPGNTIVPYNHEILSDPYYKNSTLTKLWFMNNFPRIDWDTCLVSDDEWERYVQTRGVIYPDCQYSPGSVYVVPNNNNRKQALCGIVMVGDACHAFPPDIGQGINAGLQDVVALDRALKNLPIDKTMKKSQECEQQQQQSSIGGSIALGTALLQYERNRRPEHAALIRLARFGSPYQYRQPWLRHRLGSKLWTMNVLFRVIMNRLSFGILPPAAIMILTNKPQLSYRQVMRRADIAAFCFQLMLLATCFRFCLVQLPLLLPTLFWNKVRYFGMFQAKSPTLLHATLLALILLKVIVPFCDEIECFLRREKSALNTKKREH